MNFLKSQKTTILLPPHLNESFDDIFESLGFEVLWEGKQKKEDIINRDHIDLAIEWQRKENSFPIRDFLNKYHHYEAKIFLALNWNGKPPDNFERLGFAGFLEVPFAIDKMMDKFKNVERNKTRDGMIKGNEVKEFALSIGAKEPIPGDGNYVVFRKFFKRSNYFILNGRIVIIKISRSAKPFWGVGKRYIDFLNHFDNYFLILLVSNQEGWFFDKSQINNNIEIGKWNFRKQDNNYKINFPLPSKNSFISPSDFLKKIGDD